MQALRFGLVGLIGFGVDGGVLSALMQFEFGAISARLVSLPLAISTTFILNRRFTFGVPARHTAANQFILYGGLQFASAGMNFALYAGLLACFPSWHATPVLPLAISAGFSMGITYLGSRAIFAQRPSRGPMKSQIDSNSWI